jgi:hypothetical protein
MVVSDVEGLRQVAEQLADLDERIAAVQADVTSLPDEACLVVVVWLERALVAVAQARERVRAVLVSASR